VKLFHSDRYRLPLPSNHRFPKGKYPRLRERVEQEAWLQPGDLCEADAASDEQLTLAHTPEYVRKVVLSELSEKELRRIGFPWSPEMVERSRRSVGATICACRSALEDGYAANLAGGTHHAYPDHGQGFCVFNDVGVAARVMQAEGAARRVVILDCDVHQGNGTAAIFAGDESVFTFSIHGAKNFPFRKEPGDLDIALPDGTVDGPYLEALEYGLVQSIAAARADLAIYLAGADPYLGDTLGRLALSKAGLLERDRMVFEHCLAAGLPVALTMAGGYGKDIEDTVEIHLQTLRLGEEMFAGKGYRLREQKQTIDKGGK
jgi:acetoin utilization deacetylase AcuC-like enzyme